MVHLRLKNEQYMGERLFPGSATGKDHSNPDPLHLAIRSHSNFVENVPLAMLLAVVAELNGGSRKLLNYSMAALMLFRILHVELGMYGKNTLGPGRIVGHSGTQTWLVGMAAYSAYLVKGCWGFRLWDEVSHVGTHSGMSKSRRLV